MSGDAVRAALARLREAGRKLRRRPAAERIALLGSALDGWRDPGNLHRRALEEQLPSVAGFSSQVVREGLARALEEMGSDALQALVAQELGPAVDGGRRRATGFDVTAVILAGALPTPSLVAMLMPLVLGSPVLAKPSSRDPLTPALVAASLADVDPELGACVELAAVPGADAEATAALLQADCIAASGSDGTLASIASQVVPPRRLVGYGHRVSVALLGPEALGGAALSEAARALALDVALWDQLGCLSPVSLHLVGAGERVPAAVTDAVAEGLAAAESRLPRGAVEPAAAAAFSHALADAELRAAGGAGVALRADPERRFAVVAENDPAPRPSPLHRFLRIHAAPDRESLRDALRPLGPRLAAVGAAGFAPAELRALATALAELGASRLCPLGTMQSPPLTWCHDGQPVLLPLARLVDVEGFPSGT